ncbi:MAG: TerC family protein [Burkholderiaceae bacterium]|jgi:predicted tellurium resistance membrane protein TerC|nr:TerC family protein [Gemmatimonadales bacterium]MCO5118064.1 TerC family protein [Burkholderiaceae bacterium]MEB2317464.1 TerC family protein [Pseudomonadota bacterium]
MGFEWLSDPQAWIALATLAALEIVLGIDNIIFISILVGRLPEHQRARGRFIGLGLAMIMRLLLLMSIAWIMRLTTPFFEVLGRPISGRDLILLGGGLFLLWKAVHEIHHSLEAPDAEETGKAPAVASFGAIMVQIALIDIVFSLDSVITAVGLVEHISIMVIAIVLSVAIMMVGAKPIGEFVDRHPTVKMLALSFLVMVGVVLIAEGFGQHIPKGYIYFAMAFSVTVEMLNIRLRSNLKPVRLHKTIREGGERIDP